jgi:hypothetical protein
LSSPAEAGRTTCRSRSEASTAPQLRRSLTRQAVAHRPRHRPRQEAEAEEGTQKHQRWGRGGRRSGSSREVQHGPTVSSSRSSSRAQSSSSRSPKGRGERRAAAGPGGVVEEGVGSPRRQQAPLQHPWALNRARPRLWRRRSRRRGAGRRWSSSSGSAWGEGEVQEVLSLDRCRRAAAAHLRPHLRPPARPHPALRRCTCSRRLLRARRHQVPPRELEAACHRRCPPARPLRRR